MHLLTNCTILGLALSLALPGMVFAEPGDYRFSRTPGTTKDGYPLPLTGKPLTKTPVIAENPDAIDKNYPEHYVPGRETLAADEMRITACGS